MKKSTLLLAAAAALALTAGLPRLAAAQTTMVSVLPTFTATLNNFSVDPVSQIGQSVTIFATDASNPAHQYGIGTFGIVGGIASGTIDFELSNLSLSSGDPSFPVVDPVSFTNLTLTLNNGGGTVSLLDGTNSPSTTSDPTNPNTSFLISNDVTPGTSTLATLTGTFNPARFRVNAAPFGAVAAPEPASLPLLAAGGLPGGMLALAGLRRRRKAAAA